MRARIPQNVLLLRQTCRAQQQQQQQGLPLQARYFASSRRRPAKNRIFDIVRSPQDLDTLLLLHSTRSAPLLTLWTGTYSRLCAEITPLMKSLIENEYVGLEQGGVGFAEVEIDAPTIDDLGSRYGIVQVPTLLAFAGRTGEPQLERRVADARLIQQREFLISWIEEEARRAHSGSAGAGGGGKWFGGLFG